MFSLFSLFLRSAAVAELDELREPAATAYLERRLLALGGVTETGRDRACEIAAPLPYLAFTRLAAAVRKEETTVEGA